MNLAIGSFSPRSFNAGSFEDLIRRGLSSGDPAQVKDALSRMREMSAGAVAGLLQRLDPRQLTALKTGMGGAPREAGGVGTAAVGGVVSPMSKDIYADFDLLRRAHQAHQQWDLSPSIPPPGARELLSVDRESLQRGILDRLAADPQLVRTLASGNGSSNQGGDLSQILRAALFGGGKLGAFPKAEVEKLIRAHQNDPETLGALAFGLDKAMADEAQARGDTALAGALGQDVFKSVPGINAIISLLQKSAWLDPSADVKSNMLGPLVMLKEALAANDLRRGADPRDPALTYGQLYQHGYTRADAAHARATLRNGGPPTY